MRVRDVIEAAGAAGEVSTAVLLGSEKTHAVVQLRRVGYLVASRTTGKSMGAIGVAWGGRKSDAIARGALIASSAIAAGDPSTTEFLRLTLGFLGLNALPPARPTYKLAAATLDRRIGLTEARLAALRQQRASLEQVQ